jgi:peroxiredoxin
MNRATLFLLSLFGVLSAAAQKAVIHGSISPVTPGKILTLTWINYETRNDQKVKDVAMSSSGTFDFQIEVKEPAIYSLTLEKKLLLNLLAKPGDNIELRIEQGKIESKGSPDTQALIDYETFRQEAYQHWLKPTYDSSEVAGKSGDAARIDFWSRAHEQASIKYKEQLSDWVMRGSFKNSLAAIHHSLRWHADNDLVLMDTLVSIAQRKYPNYQLTQQLKRKVISTKRIALGAEAPAFSAPDTEGNLVTLENWKGKYVLVDFWASWCGPCRIENPNLARLYEKFQGKGFDILSVSIDESKERWLKAIEKDRLIWTNLSELDGYASPVASLYNVTSIPNSFLLDPQGKIIGKNLKGKDLEQKLKELLP